MNPKQNLRILVIVLLSVFSFSAVAAPKDGAAQKKIDEAINVHYLATEFDKAEGMLLGVVKACGKDCSPNVIGKAWMYVGLVRGCGKNNLAGAKEAFEKAKSADPGVQLDAALATPEVQTAFNKAAGGGAAAPSGGETQSAPNPPAGGGDAAFACKPEGGYEIQTRQPIPVSCSVPAGVTKGELNYKAANAENFKTIPMRIESGTLRAQIPCDGVANEGSLKWYVIAQDAKGETVDTTGNELAPGEFNVVAQSSQPAPAFPGSKPPERCGVGAAANVSSSAECPPGMPGCAGTGGWGDTCTPAEKCRKGLYCASGTCENAPSCEVNADCDSGRCNDGFCDMGDSGGSSGGKFRRLMIGVHFAPDLWITTATKDVCASTSETDSAMKGTYTCYQPGQTTINTDNPTAATSDSLAVRPLGINGGYAGNINSGVKVATLRALLSVDYAFTPNVTLGGRLGYAFNGGPPSIKYNNGIPEQTTKFFPFHVEARGTYWFKALSVKGFHPYIHIGGGVAQVDGKVTVPAYRYRATSANCPTSAATAGPDYSGPCVPIGGDKYSQIDKTKYDLVQYDAWRKMGQGFGTIGGGGLIPMGDTGGIQLNLNIMFMLGSSGTVLEPSVGYVIGI